MAEVKGMNEYLKTEKACFHVSSEGCNFSQALHIMPDAKQSY